MNKLKMLSNSVLLADLKLKVESERKITREILEYLREVEDRRLFAQRGYPSLFEFCIKELGYSESSAQRRISAMRLMRSIPEVREKLQTGEVNLSTLSQLQSFIKKEETIKHTKLDLEQKRDILNQIENKSQRECERLFVQISPESAKIRENVRPVTEDLTEIKFYASKELYQKLEDLKNLLAHQNKSQTISGLIEVLVDMAQKSVSKRTSATEVKEKPIKNYQKEKRYIPAHLRRQIYSRDQGKCQFQDPLTKRTCSSKFKLQVDHIQPYSLGGHTTPENLRLLCAQHNRLEAITKLGNRALGPPQSKTP